MIRDAGRKKVLITGGTSGIGYGIAKSLAPVYDLALFYLNNHERAQQAREEIVRQFPECGLTIMSCDLRDAQQMAETYHQLKKNWGAPDILINSAGQSSSQLFLLENPETFSQLMNLNYIAPVNLIKLVAPDLIRKRDGHIINISSCSAGISIEGHSAYAPSKAALEKFTTILAGELVRYNVRANIIRPGVVITPLSEDWLKKMEEDPRKLENVLGPTKKPIEVSQICRTVEYLLGTDQVTGATLDVDNGQSRMVRY